MLTGQNGLLNRAQEAKEKTETAQKDEKIRLAVMSSLGTDGLIDLNQLKIEIESQGGSVAGTTFPVEVTNGKTSYQIDKYGNISEENKAENIEKSWIVADVSNSNNDWYAYTDNSGNKAKVNAPKLANGMTAIRYETDVTGSRWANAMTKDGSMWVWIPRYAYKITYKDVNDRSAGGTIDIAFLDTENNFLDSSIQGSVITNINAGETLPQNQWILEPAFIFGGENIAGFWFAKFEASPVGATSTTEAQTNDKTKIMQIKPNQYSWRSISAADIFEYCLNLKNMKSNNELVYFNNISNVDTHMTKNVEWGAVAYLAHSKYGLNGKEICINTNSSYLTGIGSGSTTSKTSVTDQYDTANGVTASTTKNVYGIYDMSGGAYEYVAACYTGKEETLTANEAYISKYIDVYNSYSSAKYGDAIFETSFGSSGTNSWFLDFSYVVDSLRPIFGRGGNHTGDVNAGLFNFNRGNSSAAVDFSFRPVCIVN